MHTSRIKKLQGLLTSPILIKKKENLFYLTGRSFDIRAEEYLLVTKKHVVGFGSGLEAINWIEKSDQLKNLGKYLQGKNLDIEYGFTYGEGSYLRAKCPGLRVRPVRSMVDFMREVKEPSEIAKVRKSMQIVEQVFNLVRKEIKKPKITEIKLADFIKRSGLKLGAQDVSFPPIVASGINAAISHHVPTNKVLKTGESIILDFGFKYQNYCSDFTRTVFLKKVNTKLETAYLQVEKAYNGSIEFCNHPSLALPLKGREKIQRQSLSFLPLDGGGKVGVKAGDVYQHAVNVLAEKKMDKYFIHSLGHGTGLEIHENPSLSPNSNNILKNGMVFSIEPGVYIPKVGGVRIEDLVYLKQGAVEKFIEVSTKLKDNILW